MRPDMEYSYTLNGTRYVERQHQLSLESEKSSHVHTITHLQLESITHRCTVLDTAITQQLATKFKPSASRGMLGDSDDTRNVAQTVKTQQIKSTAFVIVDINGKIIDEYIPDNILWACSIETVYVPTVHVAYKENPAHSTRQKVKHKPHKWGTSSSIANNLRLPYGVVQICHPKDGGKLRLVVKQDSHHRLGIFLRLGHDNYKQLFYILDFTLHPLSDDILERYLDEYQQISRYFVHQTSYSELLAKLGFNVANCPWKNVVFVSEQLKAQRKLHQGKRPGKREREKNKAKNVITLDKALPSKPKYVEPKQEPIQGTLQSGKYLGKVSKQYPRLQGTIERTDGDVRKPQAKPLSSFDEGILIPSTFVTLVK